VLVAYALQQSWNRSIPVLFYNKTAQLSRPFDNRTNIPDIRSWLEIWTSLNRTARLDRFMKKRVVKTIFLIIKWFSLELFNKWTSLWTSLFVKWSKNKMADHLISGHKYVRILNVSAHRESGYWMFTVIHLTDSFVCNSFVCKNKSKFTWESTDKIATN
jgi:hypothetical protein